MGRPRAKKQAVKQRRTRVGLEPENLPDLVILKIIGYLPDTRSVLAASAVCRRWRYLVLDKSSLVLKQEQVVVFNCVKRVRFEIYPSPHTVSEYRWRQQQICITKKDIKMMLKFLPHIHTLIFEWCVCKTEKLLKVLDEIIENSEKIKVKKVQIKGNIPNAVKVGTCQRNRVLEDGINWKIELFTAFLERCKMLEILDFGFEPDLCRNLGLLVNVTSKDKFGNANLHTLNIAGLNRAPFDCTSIADQLKSLSTVCMTWDKHFVDFVLALSSKSASKTNIKDLIVTVAGVDGEVPCVTDEQWTSLRECQPGLKLKLVVVEDCFWLPQCVNCMHNQLADGTIPIAKLTVICNASIDFIPWGTFAATIDQVEELSWICYNDLDRPFYDGHYVDFSFFYSGSFCKFTHLKKLAFHGMLINRDIMIGIASLFGRKLEDFVVVQRDIARVYGPRNCDSWRDQHILEQNVSTELGRNWKAVDDDGLGGVFFEEWTLDRMERFLQKTCTM